MITQKIIYVLMILCICQGSLLFTGCSHLNSAGESQALSNSAYPVIGQLKTRDKLIIISSGPEHPLYSVISDSGQVLAVDVPSDRLASRFPELKDLIESGIANWAGLDWWYRHESNIRTNESRIHMRFY